MAVSQNDVVAQMRSALALTEPDLDTTIGTTTRKILDAVGEAIAESYVDRYLLNYQYDIDAKSGADLDNFVQLFGFSRLPAKRASGSVTFERAATVSVNSIIAQGSQFSTTDAVPILVATVVPGVLLRGDTSITVAAQAVLGGASGNVPANSLSLAVTPVPGVGSFSNTSAFTGGADAESDDQLRNRFKKTVFRNLAGTEQMFTALALENDNVSQVNVIGSSQRHREQVQLDASGTATSTLVGSRYVYDGSAVFGPSIDAGNVLTPGIHYAFSTTTPPTITSLDSTLAPAGGVFDLTFEYVPTASRNDPTGGVTNRIDIYINGSVAETASETAIFRATKTFNSSYVQPPVVNTPVASALNGGMAAGTYFYKVTATNSLGETVSSNEVSVVVAGSVLSPPTLATAVTQPTGGALPAGTAYSYKITGINASGETVGSNEKTVTTIASLAAPVLAVPTTATTGGTGLAASTTYFYKVTALNDAGQSLGSNERSIATGAGATNSISLSWAAVTGATGYRVYRGTAAGAESIYYFVGATTTFVDQGSSANVAGTVPTTNTSSTATNANVLTWPALPGALSYRVYRGTAAGAENAFYAVGNVTTYTDTGAATTAGSPPSPGTATTTTSSVALTWAASANATGYKIYRGTASGAENVLVTSVGAATSYTDVGATGTGATPPLTSKASGDPLAAANFLRSDSTPVVSGNYFLPLSFAPVLDATQTGQITIGSVTYIEGVDFWAVNDITREGGSFRSLSGIEFKSAANGQAKAIPADGTQVALTYTFNALPRDIEESVRAWRLITTDVRVHQAKPVLLDFFFAVILSNGYTISGVQGPVEAAISAYINGVGFNGVVQVSDLIEIVHQVPGVDAVRFLTSKDDAVHFGIQRVSNTDSILTSYATTGGLVSRAIDVIVGDDEVPYFNRAVLSLRAQNSMGPV